MTTTRTTDVDEDTEHVTCDACRHAWTEQVRADTRCPACGSTDLTVTGAPPGSRSPRKGILMGRRSR